MSGKRSDLKWVFRCPNDCARAKPNHTGACAYCGATNAGFVPVLYSRAADDKITASERRALLKMIQNKIISKSVTKIPQDIALDILYFWAKAEADVVRLEDEVKKGKS